MEEILERHLDGSALNDSWIMIKGKADSAVSWAGRDRGHPDSDQGGPTRPPQWQRAAQAWALLQNKKAGRLNR